MASSTPSASVLIVDDDQEFAAMLSDYVRDEGFQVDAVHDGKTGLQTARSGNYEILILDVMLPELSGTEVLQKLREFSQLPVLMLTARGDDIDRIVGLELGADDYLPKPCNPREVVARLRAILRRANGPPIQAEICNGPLKLNSANRVAQLADQRLELTSTEFSILEILTQRVGTAVSKDELSRHALQRPLGRHDRSVDMHISHLRKKLEDDLPGLIQTIRGVGYQMIVLEESR